MASKLAATAVWAVLAFGSVLSVQAQGRHTGAKQEQRPDLARKIIQSVSGLPTVLSADLLLRVAAVSAAPATMRKHAALEAYELAPGLPQPWPRVRAFSGNTDTLASFEAGAASLDLDQLSVEIRAAMALRPLDAELARQRFNSIPLPDLPVENCKDGLAYDLGGYFHVLGAMYPFTPGQIAGAEPVLVLSPYLERISSVEEIAPAAKLISALGVPSGQRGQLAQALAKGIGNLKVDPRLSVWSALPTARALGNLAHACGGSGCTTALAAYRAYLVQALRGGLCYSISQQRELQVFTRLNQMFQSAGLDPLTLKSAAIAMAPLRQNRASVWTAAGAQPLMDAWRRLVAQAPAPGRLSPAALDSFDTQVAAWPADGVGVKNKFLVEAMLLVAPIHYLKPGGQRRAAVASYVAFLDQTSARTQAPQLWLLMVSRLLASVGSGGKARLALAAAFATTTSPEMQLYGAAYRLAAADVQGR